MYGACVSKYGFASRPVSEPGADIVHFPVGLRGRQPRPKQQRPCVYLPSRALRATLLRAKGVNLHCIYIVHRIVKYSYPTLLP